MTNESYLQRVFQRRELLWFLVRGNLKAMHKYTFLGYVWWMLEPLLLMAVYVLVFQGIFRVGTRDFAVFLFCAILPWRAFVTSVNNSMSAMVRSGGIIKLVAFPKAVIPLSSVATNFVNFCFGLPVLFGLVWAYGIPFSITLLWLPVLMLCQAFLTLGFALLFAATNIYVRDLQNLTRHLFRAWWYLSPGLYGIERIPERFHTAYKLLNPFAVYFSAYRDCVMYGRSPEIPYLAFTAALSILILGLGWIVFTRAEERFVKVL